VTAHSISDEETLTAEIAERGRAEGAEVNAAAQGDRVGPTHQKEGP